MRGNVLLLMAQIAITMAELAPPPTGWPIFHYQGVITNKTKLAYNPTNEFIFPTVFRAGIYLKNPLAEWYMVSHSLPHKTAF